MQLVAKGVGYRAWCMRNRESSGVELTTSSKAAARGRTWRTSCSAATATVKNSGAMAAGGSGCPSFKRVLLNMWRSEPIRQRMTCAHSRVGRDREGGGGSS